MQTRKFAGSAEEEEMVEWSGCGWMVELRISAGLVFLLFLLLLAGCGSGDGSDDNDNMNGAGLQPTLQSIQANIFTPICAVPGCHVGANAQRGLMLDSVENSFLDLVGISSDEIPTILRVDPGNPDNSYIVQKLEGAPNIAGDQMPLNQPPLSADQISAIRQWILDGALQ